MKKTQRLKESIKTNTVLKSLSFISCLAFLHIIWSDLPMYTSLVSALFNVIRELTWRIIIIRLNVIGEGQLYTRSSSTQQNISNELFIWSPRKLDSEIFIKCDNNYSLLVFPWVQKLIYEWKKSIISSSDLDSEKSLKNLQNLSLQIFCRLCSTIHVWYRLELVEGVLRCEHVGHPRATTHLYEVNYKMCTAIDYSNKT